MAEVRPTSKYQQQDSDQTLNEGLAEYFEANRKQLALRFDSPTVERFFRSSRYGTRDIRLRYEPRRRCLRLKKRWPWDSEKRADLHELPLGHLRHEFGIRVV